METEGTATSAAGTGARFLRGSFTCVLHVVRMTLYAVLALLRPLIVGALKAVSVLGLLACLFYVFFMRGTHFPVGVMLILSAGCAVCVVLYYALMDLLLPR